MGYFFSLCMAIPFLSLLMLAAGCGASTTTFQVKERSGDGEGRRRVPWPADEVSMESEADEVFEGFDTGDADFVGNGTSAQRVWINFAGSEVSADDSHIVASLNLVTIAVPAFVADDLGDAYVGAEELAVVTRVMEDLAERFADVAIELTNVEPEPPYTTIHVGGNNITPRPNLLGTAPLDIGNFNRDDIGFVFSKDLVSFGQTDNFSLLVNAIAHELGHTLGTRHIVDDEAIMSPALDAFNVNFNRTGPYPDATGRENSRDVLLHNLGRGATRLRVVTPPALVALTAERSGDIVQLSLLNRENSRANPQHDLHAFEYNWTYNDMDAVGTVVRVRLTEPGTHELRVRVRGLDEESDMEEEVLFVVEKDQ